MSTLWQGASIGFCVLGAAFFLAGSAGLLRFPDTMSRLHALTKADNLGLGFIVLGLAMESGSWAVAGKLAVIWVLAILAGSSACYLIARHIDEGREGGGE